MPPSASLIMLRMYSRRICRVEVRTEWLPRIHRFRCYLPAVIDVLTLAGDKISGVTAFMTPDALGRPPAAGELPGADMFALFGLPDWPAGR
jgi:hypothetical protein